MLEIFRLRLVFCSAKNTSNQRMLWNFSIFFVLQKFREIKECFVISAPLFFFLVLQKFREIKECFVTSASLFFFLVLKKFREIKVQESNSHKCTKLQISSYQIIPWMNVLFCSAKISWNQRMTQSSDPCCFCCKNIVQEIAVVYFTTIKLGVFY